MEVANLGPLTFSFADTYFGYICIYIMKAIYYNNLREKLTCHGLSDLYIINVNNNYNNNNNEIFLIFSGFAKMAGWTKDVAESLGGSEAGLKLILGWI